MKPKNLTKILIIIVILLSVSLTITAAKLISINKNIKGTNDIKPPIEEIPKDVVKKEPITEENVIDNESPGEPTIEKPSEPTKIDEPPVEQPVVNKPVVNNQKPPAKNENIDNHGKVNDEDEYEDDDDEEHIDIIEPKYISEEEAINIALKKIGKKSTVLEIEHDFDYNPPKYELKIKKNKFEYEIEIHARTGAILDYEKEKVE